MTDNNAHTVSSSSFPPSDWVETTLGEVVEISSGKSRPKNKGNFPVYGGNGILDYADNFNFENETIIIGRVGAYCGCVYFEKEKFWLSDNALGIKANQKSDIKFLYYFLINQDLNKKAIGGAQPLLTQGILNQIEIIIPPLPEQQAIASVLSAFDDKIELLREQNKTLEEMGQVIFQEWFGKYGVDDDKVNAEGREGGLGQLPEGWRAGKLGEVVKFVQGTQVPSEYQIEEQREDCDKFLRIVDYMSNFSEKPRYIPKKDSNTYCNEDEIIMVRYGEVGFVGRRMAGVFANNLFKISPKEPMNNDFLYYFLKSNDIQQYIKNNSAGSALPAIKHSTVGDIELIIPPKQVLEEFREFAQKTERKISHNNSQIQSLARSRDELLPRLMRGEVRVEF